MNRTLTSLSLALLAATAPTAAAGNVLIVVGDDIGTDYVGAYGEGSTTGPTPTLDALAQHGVLFRNAWAYPNCSPTRACFQTGRFGYRTGVGSPGGNSNLAQVEVTLPEALDAAGAGVAHAYFGKWHIGGGPNHPNAQGWSHFAGSRGNIDDYFDWTRTVDGVSAQSTTYATTQNVDDALAWIGAQTQPWLSVVAFNAPHGPRHVPPADLHTQDVQANPGDAVTEYVAMIEAMDNELERLLLGLGDDLADTTVLFFGDNGTPSPVSVAPFASNHAKGSPYEGGVGVPMIAFGPGVDQPGREVDALVNAVDVFATVADLFDVDLSDPFVRRDSISLVPYLEDADQPPLRSVVYSESFEGADKDANGFAVARDARYKLIRRYDATGVASEELYDLVATPFETVDLLPTLTAPEQAAYDRLDAHILAVRASDGTFAALGPASCPGSNGAPAIAGIGTPRIGAAYGVALSQAPAGAVTFLATGFSATADAQLGVALPLDLSAFGAGAGCRLDTSLELLTPFAASAAGTAATTVDVPDVATLVAVELFHSWLVHDAAGPGNTVGVTVSPGLAVTIGE